MIASDGFCARIAASTASKSVVPTKVTLDFFSLSRRLSRSPTWSADSSPEIYKTPRAATANCITIVDFPMPGSPASKIREPGTMPPPKISLTSGAPVLRRLCSVPVAACSFNKIACTATADLPKEFPDFFFGSSGTSVNVLHALQERHFPDHFWDFELQALQRNI